MILKGILEKEYRIKKEFENEAYFRAFLGTMDEEQKKVLFKLISDSERHKLILENLAKEIGIKFEKRDE
ncbi:MAG: hypothetical protein RMH75_00865 [Archaeoglobaceae archaeon]|nr:hypothetical protein [Archaeoglobaceae archaeon]MDW7989210.1 hypothetical protein [Archaeoglobaceae archaeon]